MLAPYVVSEAHDAVAVWD